MTTLSREAALAAVKAVLGRLGGGDADLELLGPIVDNAVFRLPAGVVARISGAPSYERAAREVRTGNWLATQGVSAVRPLEVADLPWSVDGLVVTLWHEVPEAEMASTAELGGLLRGLHAVPVPSDFAIPALDPFVRVDEHLAAAAGALEMVDRQFLVDQLDELRPAYAAAAARLPDRVIHGDANRKNAIRGRDGITVLLDLERFSLGPREWDLVVPAVYQRLGWYSDPEYDAFVEAYGWDVRSWEGFAVFATVREFRMTAWLVSRLAREPRLAAEAGRRIASLRNPDAPRAWTPGV
ncbi:aminoglycoside phosphotransferase family protein [Kribbella sp. NBC_01505]|uniref:phosphotransferase family protein n=1 Tax=Kribbella sp. NBC_01505 TaxID=2903580 RepID=UPI00386E2314